MNESSLSLPPVISLSVAELDDLCRAKWLLENPGLAARLSNALGAPLERGFALLPKNWSAIVNRFARSALLRALEIAVWSMPAPRAPASADLRHKVMVGTSGWIGGAFGFTALAVELPVSTTIMLRSIADIARREGHDLHDVGTRLSCLEVFALGGPARSDDAAETGYWAVRAAMSKVVAEAVTYLTEKSVLERSAPAVVRLVGTLASRFGVVISEQAAAKAVPILGAISGSAINVLFMDHFQKMAHGHFIVKRLEKKYGFTHVREIYRSIAVPVAS